MNLPKEVRQIIDILNENNYEAYVVGGSVRDSLMGKTPTDFDIATSATPKEIKAIFAKTVDTGTKFGTVTVLLNSKTYEVTTFRIDGPYKDHRKPTEVNFTGSLTEDLARRDFTINAIAYHKNHNYIDPFNGAADIKDKCIRGVGHPPTRFKEDALRMMRCIRFAVKLGFTIDHATYDALVENAHLISKISMERIRDELEKILLGNYIQFSTIINECHILKYVDEGLYTHFQTHLNKTIPFLKNCEKDIITKAAILFKNYEKPLKPLLQKLKYSNDQISKTISLVDTLSPPINSPNKYEIKKLLLKLGNENFRRWLHICEVFSMDTTHTHNLHKDIIKNNEPISLKDMKITGDILAANNIVSPGKEMGDILAFLHQAILKDPSLNETRALLKLAKNIRSSL